jgi:hypothetical protein
MLSGKGDDFRGNLYATADTSGAKLNQAKAQATTASGGGGIILAKATVLELVALCCLPGAVWVQFSIDSWTADTGLPQNVVLAICQDKEGYLWLATLDGLARFDGVRFTILNNENTPGISSNRFVSLYCATSGNVWAGIERNGVTRWNRGRNRERGNRCTHSRAASG